MKSFEFVATVDGDNKLTVPSDVAHELRQRPVRVVLALVSEDEEERAWVRHSAAQYQRWDTEGDEAYDRL
jgi:bifunctional DNA-binding transcriptional regulator/antitoxin component of YhaV-PrlF toxin-antitoxin module